MLKPDLLFAKAGHPIIAVEAKSRPVSRDFESAVHRQLQVYSTQLGTRWALLVDPREIRIFKLTKPFASLSTEEFLSEAFPSRPGVIGEQTLLLAVNRLLPKLSHRRDFLRRHPELEELASDLVDAEPIVQSL